MGEECFDLEFEADPKRFFALLKVLRAEIHIFLAELGFLVQY